MNLCICIPKITGRQKESREAQTAWRFYNWLWHKFFRGQHQKTPVAWQVLLFPGKSSHRHSLRLELNTKFHEHNNPITRFHSCLSSMVLNKVRLTEDSLFDPAKPEDAKPLHKGWLLKNPIAERDSMSVNVLACMFVLRRLVVWKCGGHVLNTLSLVHRKGKWKVPGGRAKRRWFVLTSTSDKNVPALLYYADDKETSLKVLSVTDAKTCVIADVSGLWD